MKRVRVLSVIYCILAAVLFATYLINERQVLDNQGPVIHMSSDSIEISMLDDNSRILEGITAEDDRDGDTTHLMVVEQLTNFLEDGRRQATIAAFDRAGNVTKVEREVLYTDYEPPYFEVTLPFSYPENTSSITKNIKAYDHMDGDITSRIRLSSEEGITTSKAGFYDAIFTVSNSAGDTQKLPVTVEIYDTAERSRKPNLLLSKYLIYLERDEEFEPRDYIEEVYYGARSYVRSGSSTALIYNGTSVPSGIGATLPLGDIVIDNPVDTSVPGVYEVEYSYSWEESVPGTVRLIVVVRE